MARQSEKDGSLKWDKTAIQSVFDLTHGHPYFTQLLCSVVWENAYEATPRSAPTVSAKDVENAVVQALKFGANAFNWLWDGLPPAERVVVAAMAEVKDEVITQDKLIETLNQSGVRLVARELEFAPETLIDWEVLIESGGAYRFAVPLLQRWVLANRPLRRVKEELDRLDPLAETLFQGGQGFYNNNNLDAAEQQLREALKINPNHLKGRLLLGRILLEKGHLVESVDMFDAAYQYDERSARADFIKSLLALAETQEENLQLSTYERILKIQIDQPLANEKFRAIWVKRGEAAQAQENYEEAQRAFEQVGDAERIGKVRSLMHEKKLALDMQRAEVYEKTEQWKSALDILLELTSEYPESETLRARVATVRMNWRAESLKLLDDAEIEESWSKALELCEELEKNFTDDVEIKSRSERARAQVGVMQKYHEALGALQSGQTDQARKLLAEVAIESPTFGRASLKLVEAMYGRVKILFPVPPIVKFFAFVIPMVWTLSLLFGLSGWAANLIAKYYMAANQGTIVYYYIIRVETFIGLGAILISLVGVLLSSYINNVVDITYQVERDKISYIKALWTHAVLGMGLFYAKPEARRKWLYALIALLISLLVLAQIFFELTKFMRIRELHFETVENGLVVNILEVTLWIFLGLHVLSFADVLGTCYLRRRDYRGAKRERWERMPDSGKQVSQQHGIAVSVLEIIRKLAQRIKLAVQGFLRCVKSLTLMGWLGVLALLELVTAGMFVKVISIVPLPMESPWFGVLGFLALVFSVLMIALLIVAFIVAFRFALKTINGFIAKNRRSDSSSTKKELDPTKDKTI